MGVLIVLFVFIFGTIVGSFLNVVIYRYNTGRGLGGRSKCFSCGQMIRWFSLVPVISFIFQRGRCYNCNSKISWQYPMVEIITGFVFLLTFLRFGLFALWFYALIGSILIIIALYDLRHKIIPDGLVYFLIVAAFAKLVYDFYRFNDLSSVWSLTAGILFFLFLSSLWLFSGGKWMGLGDAKLVLALGWLLPTCLSLSFFILSFWIGALVGIILSLSVPFSRRVLGYRVDLKSEIPFAPFIILSFFLVLFFNFDVVSLAGANCLIAFEF